MSIIKEKAVFSHVVNQVRLAIREHQLLPRSQRVLVALSGGQDSLTLAETLNYLHVKDGKWASLSLAHCDHGWPLDKGTTKVIEHHANRLKLPLHMVEAEDVQSIMSETKAREWRYKELGRIARDNGYDAVVTGHTRSDLAETMIYNLCKGTGIEGLSSLTWKRLCNTNKIDIVRPLLNVSRAETLQFCEERNLWFWSDPYNDKVQFTRNRVRHEIIPLLQKTINPKVEDALVRSAQLLTADLEHLEEQVNLHFSQCVVHRTSDNDFIVCLNRQKLASLSVAMQRRIIRRALHQFIGLSYTSKTFVQVEALRSLIHRPINSSIPSLCNNTVASVFSDQLIVIRHPSAMVEPAQRQDQSQVRGDRRTGKAAEANVT